MDIAFNYHSHTQQGYSCYPSSIQSPLIQSILSDDDDNQHIVDENTLNRVSSHTSIASTASLNSTSSTASDNIMSRKRSSLQSRCIRRINTAKLNSGINHDIQYNILDTAHNSEKRCKFDHDIISNDLIDLPYAELEWHGYNDSTLDLQQFGISPLQTPTSPYTLDYGDESM